MKEWCCTNIYDERIEVKRLFQKDDARSLVTQAQGAVYLV